MEALKQDFNYRRHEGWNLKEKNICFIFLRVLRDLRGALIKY